MNGAVSLVLAAIAVAFATTHVVLAIKVSGQATVGAAGTRLAYLGSFAFDTSDHEAALAVLLSNASRSLTGTAEFEGVVTGFVGPANAPVSQQGAVLFRARLLLQLPLHRRRALGGGWQRGAQCDSCRVSTRVQESHSYLSGCSVAVFRRTARLQLGVRTTPRLALVVLQRSG